MTTGTSHPHELGFDGIPGHQIETAGAAGRRYCDDPPVGVGVSEFRGERAGVGHFASVTTTAVAWRDAVARSPTARPAATSAIAALP